MRGFLVFVSSAYQPINSKVAAGQKYEMAHKFGVKVVSVEWVQKSVEKGSCLDHRKFPVRVAGSFAGSE